jgi:hypothetical protein
MKVGNSRERRSERSEEIPAAGKKAMAVWTWLAISKTVADRFPCHTTKPVPHPQHTCTRHNAYTCLPISSYTLKDGHADSFD